MANKPRAPRSKHLKPVAYCFHIFPNAILSILDPFAMSYPKDSAPSIDTRRVNDFYRNGTHLG